MLQFSNTRICILYSEYRIYSIVIYSLQLPRVSASSRQAGTGHSFEVVVVYVSMRGARLRLLLVRLQPPPSTSTFTFHLHLPPSVFSVRVHRVGAPRRMCALLQCDLRCCSCCLAAPRSVILIRSRVHTRSLHSTSNSIITIITTCLSIRACNRCYSYVYG